MRSKKGNRKIGNWGEEIAANHLARQGFVIIERNYWRKWGELDIVARKHDLLYFIEVKTVSYETRAAIQTAISRGTWRPEEQVHRRKLQQVNKASQTWLEENAYTGEWTIAVVALYVARKERYATLKFIPDVF